MTTLKKKKNEENVEKPWCECKLRNDEESGLFAPSSFENCFKLEKNEMLELICGFFAIMNEDIMMKWTIQPFSIWWDKENLFDWDKVGSE